MIARYFLGILLHVGWFEVYCVAVFLHPIRRQQILQPPLKLGIHRHVRSRSHIRIEPSLDSHGLSLSVYFLLQEVQSRWILGGLGRTFELVSLEFGLRELAGEGCLGGAELHALQDLLRVCEQELSLDHVVDVGLVVECRFVFEVPPTTIAGVLIDILSCYGH